MRPEWARRRAAVQASHVTRHTSHGAHSARRCSLSREPRESGTGFHARARNIPFETLTPAAVRHQPAVGVRQSGEGAFAAAGPGGGSVPAAGGTERNEDVEIRYEVNGRAR